MPVRRQKHSAVVYTYLFHVILRLHFEHIFINAAVNIHKLGMTSVLAKLAVREYGYLVRKSCRGQPVGNINGCAPPHKLVELLIYFVFRNGVKSACRFVKDEQGRFFVNGSGNSELLRSPPENSMPFSLNSLNIYVSKPSGSEFILLVSALSSIQVCIAFLSYAVLKAIFSATLNANIRKS